MMSRWANLSFSLILGSLSLFGCQDPSVRDSDADPVGESDAGGAPSSEAGAGGSTGGDPTSGAGSALCPGGVDDLTTFLPEPYPLPLEATVDPSKPTGSLTDVSTYSSALYGDAFPYRVYVSPKYTPDTPAHVLVFQDGGLYLDQFKAAVVLDHLTASSEVPVVIALFIDAPAGGEQRRIEVYDDPSDKYANFLSDEIVPNVVTSAYSVSTVERFATVGFSAGATQAMAALLYRGDVFGRSLQHNSSFLAAKANGVDLSMLVPFLRAPIHVGLSSGENDLSDQRGHWLLGNRTMAAALRASGHAVRMIEGTGGHYPPLQGIADFPDALRWLYSDCLEK